MSKSHVFSVDDAIKYGVEKAVILQNLRFWLEKVKANDKDEHKHDGYYWTYNSARAFAEIFPYYNKSKVHRLLTQLEEDGVIISGNFNKAGYDRTKWYSMPEFSISNNCNNQIAEVQNGNSESATPIPYVITDVNPDVNPNTTESEKKETKKSKSSATEKSKTQKPEVKPPAKLDDLIGFGVDPQVASDFLKKHKNQQITQTALTRNRNQAKQAGLTLAQAITYATEQGWVAFTAEYYFNRERRNQNQSAGSQSHENHQSDNSQHQPKRSQADIYADKLNAELAQRFPDEFAAPDSYYEARDCKSV